LLQVVSRLSLSQSSVHIGNGALFRPQHGGSKGNGAVGGDPTA